MSAQSLQRVLFFAILVLGASLRMWQITDRGPYLYDDAVFHAEARWMDDVWKGAKRSLAVKMEEARTGEDLWKFDAEVRKVFGLAQGRVPQFGRPGMDLLIFLMMRLTGSTPYAGPLASATLGSLSLVLVYGVASRLFGGRAGLLAMLFAAINGFEIFYDRTGLGETASTFFVLLGLYAQVRAFQAKDAREQLWMIGAGLAWGAAVLTHSRILIQVAIPVFIEVGAWFLWKERRWPEKVARAVVFGLSVLAPLLAMELPYYLSVLVANAWDFPVTWRTYLQVLVRHVMIGAAAVAMPEGAGPTWNALLFPYAFWLASGPVFVLAALGGMAVALRRRSLGDGMLLVWIAVPLAVALGAIPRPRYISIALPAFAILAAVGVDWLWEWASRVDAAPGWRRRLPANLVALAMLAGLWRAAWVIDANRDGYREAMAWLDSQGARHILFQPPIGVAYRGDMALDREPEYGPEEVRRLYEEEGYRYWVDDIYAETFRDLLESARPFVTDPGVLEKVARLDGLYALIDDLRKMRPVHTVPNPFATNPLVEMEMGSSLRRELEFVREVAPKHAEIRIYDLKAYFEGGGADLEAPEGGHHAQEAP